MDNSYEKHFLDSLLELGLTKQEATLYLTSLELGPGPVNNLAKKLSISRPNIYKLIAGLEKHGLATFADKKKYGRNFGVESPTVVLEKLRAKEKSLNVTETGLLASLPHFLAMHHQGESPTKIKIFQGREQFIKLYEQIIEESGQEIKFCGSAGTLINFVQSETERKWREIRMKRNIKIKTLVFIDNEFEELKSGDTKENRETRLLPAKIFETSFMLFGNKTIIWQPKAPLAILIEDQYISQMFESLFDFSWEKAK